LNNQIHWGIYILMPGACGFRFGTSLVL